MNIEAMKKLIQDYALEHKRFQRKTQVAERYYKNENDILRISKSETYYKNPLRNSDNRISHNFYGLLVNQKASYLFTAPPLFDIGNNEANDKIAEVLGDKYAKVCKDLCINASHCGVAWLHIWKDQKGNFKYAVVDSKQILPIWSTGLDKTLLAVCRTYNEVDNDGNILNIYEYWTDKSCFVFKKKSNEGLHSLSQYNTFVDINCDLNISNTSHVLKHDFGEVPFIAFFNNELQTSDLDNVKSLIDSYDKVFSGFMNDLEDIQEVIFLLTNYGGQDLNEFMHNLKKYKTVKLDSDGVNDKSDLTTLTIDIPVEAREKMLKMTRKAIFEQGQGVDPDPQNFGNTSGVALKYLYSLLELKAGLMETEFKLSFGVLIRAICKYLGIPVKLIIQTWTRTAITNDAELVDMANKSLEIISLKSILKNHPFVENADKEEEQIKKEKMEQTDIDDYTAEFEQLNNNTVEN